MRAPCAVVEKDQVCGKLVVGSGYCSTHYARFRRNGSPLLPKLTQNPGWGNGGGASHQRWWTKRRVLASLRTYAQLRPNDCPTSDHDWNSIKKGINELPPSYRVLEYFGTMARAWIAAGVDRKSLKMTGTRWSAAEKQYLLNHAGNHTLEAIARHLNRTYASVKSMIGAKGMKITARANQGLWSANQVSQHYGCSYKRVLDLLNAGTLVGHRHQQRQTWLIDPADITPAIEQLLREPPKTHKDHVSVGIPDRDRSSRAVYVPPHVVAAVLAAPVVRTATLPSGMTLTVKKLWEGIGA